MAEILWRVSALVFVAAAGSVLIGARVVARALRSEPTRPALYAHALWAIGALVAGRLLMPVERLCNLDEYPFVGMGEVLPNEGLPGTLVLLLGVAVLLALERLRLRARPS